MTRRRAPAHRLPTRGNPEKKRKKSGRGDDRTLPIGPEDEVALREQRDAFIAKFGREPGPRDPIFFDPNSDVPRPLQQSSIDEVMDVFVQAAATAGIDPVLVYAMKKTGRIVTAENRQFLSDDDLREWEAAVAEARKSLAKKQ